MNTEQFDGHTPGPWHEILMQGDEYNNGYADLQERGFNEAAQDLIAAAPDLLAEVKRMRSQLMDAAYWLYDLREGCLPDACWPEIDALIETHTFGGEEE